MNIEDEIDDLVLLDSGSEQDVINHANQCIDNLLNYQKSYFKENQEINNFIQSTPSINDALTELNNLLTTDNSIKFTTSMQRKLNNFLKSFVSEIYHTSTSKLHSETEIIELQTLNEHLNDQNTDLQEKQEDLEQLNANLQAKIKDLTILNQTKVNELIIEVEKKERTILELNDQLSINKRHLERLQGMINASNLESAQSQQITNDLKIKTDKKTNKIQKMQLLLHDMSVKQHDLWLQNQKLVAISNEYRDQINELNIKLANTSPEKLNATITKLSDSILSLTQQYQVCLQKSKEKSTIIDKLRNIIQKQEQIIESYDVSLKKQIHDKNELETSILDESKMQGQVKTRELMLNLQDAVENEDVLEGISKMKSDFEEKMKKLKQQNINLSNICIAMVKFMKIDTEFNNSEIPKEYFEEILKAEKAIGENGVDNELVGTVQEEIKKISAETEKYLEIVCSFSIFSSLMNSMRLKYETLKQNYDKTMSIAYLISDIFKLPFNNRLPQVIQAKFEKMRYFYENLQKTTNSYDSDAVVAYVHNAKSILDDIKEAAYPALKYSGPLEEFPFFVVDFAKSHDLDLAEEVKKKTEVISHLRKRLEETKSELNNMKNQNDSKNNEINSLQNENKNSRKMIEKLSNENTILKNADRTRENEMMELNIAVNEYAKQIAEKTKQCEDLEKKFQKVSEDNAKLIEDHRNEMEKLNKSKEESIQELKNHHDEQINKIIKGNITRESELTQEIKNLKRNFAKYQKKMSEVVKKYETTINDQKEASDSLIGHISLSKLNTSQGDMNEIETLKNLVKALEAENAGLKNNLEENKNSISEAVKNRDNYWTLKLNTQKETYQQELDNLLSENQNLNQTIEEISLKLEPFAGYDQDVLSQIEIVQNKFGSLPEIRDQKDKLTEWTDWSKKYDISGVDSANQIRRAVDDEIAKIQKLNDIISTLRKQKNILIKIATMSAPSNKNENSIRPLIISLVGIARIKRTIRK
ncbi:hypothetical protein TVAG_359950 [Trichomonas vaginalis G3]|uniref:Uncharacterized protein n=1 Tax=Trichomonas vaginalis (strain ATCC PRA-98 / G3) TaxID=412133 RepID=A2DTB4_TRIV3|nr:A-type inclusion protein-related family [Trichomonas vaginalis G3]EAY16386.1 hypothetical protein TVAG_359950 [Trichomonas vaginalis G3]KAI5488386.1 A-type inclusion protein-related family [Trichomonas vaginalis G3]|eukprot:XP_001328609.1 hypothetical protein [Trichomonas vaginalis G3]